MPHEPISPDKTRTRAERCEEALGGIALDVWQKIEVVTASSASASAADESSSVSITAARCATRCFCWCLDPAAG